MIEQVALITRTLLIGSNRIFGTVKNHALPIMVLIVLPLLITVPVSRVHFQQDDITLQSIENPYDLNNDGFVSEADFIIYRDTLQKIDFDGNGQVDIFDQTRLAYQVVDVYTLYLPIIFKNR